MLNHLVQLLYFLKTLLLEMLILYISCEYIESKTPGPVYILLTPVGCYLKPLVTKLVAVYAAGNN